jgi:carbamoyl-phosphate synthase large subunit
MSGRGADFLVTNVGAKVLLIQALKEAQANRGRILGIDIDRNSAALYFCDRWLLAPPRDSAEYLPFLEDLVCREGIGVIIPTADAEMRGLVEHRSRFEPDTLVLAPAADVVETCQDKLRFHEWLEAEGFPSIPTWASYSEDVPVPAIVKPRRGAGAMLVRVVSNRGELKELMHAQPSLLVQALIPGTEYTLDCFSDLEGRCLSVVPRVRIQVLAGESKVGRTVADRDLVELGHEMANRLGLIGHSVLQCFRTPEGRLHVIEVNPRFGGASNLSFAAGRPSPRYLVDLLEGRRPAIEPYRVGLTMLRYSQDHFISDD